MSNKAFIESQLLAAQNPLALENQVCFSLYSAANAMIRAYRPLLDELSLTYPQYLVMMVLWKEPGISVKTLGDKLHLDSGTLTPLLKRLENKALVTRGRSELDERVRVLHVTVQGQQLYQQALTIPEQMRCKVGGSIEDLQQLKQLCDQAFIALNSGEVSNCEM
ncbi:MarR family winged helix-turn-helix transcriptional regulator [Shewanella sp. MEBiC00475]|uniref:MarR family winged helix-turn-helix transcriptional regulator n=1 Tax=Shewanella sp. MEBiC00475 TaxID=2575361 RepID=UPI0010C0D808|nr:MarR family transcriptional regulator [Shewanella sp. MEBiC00475]